ncbi:ArsR/SmtB family transcription factor [Humibacter ginsenosidimutans]|uniref:Helix-turn-helix transcriptional regulator n=1 Tax=Humibacter ginsenosidimutans TaxID=2599293 RepID=A0A5B8M3R1_9MICO|nr:helix-turn-helix transcriptional regulator [Humibacter ginsenosidimutans]QDZ14599.1 helix-turn-helix transcriptional regulator [Humibacter ginsenosidimutans]
MFSVRQESQGEPDIAGLASAFADPRRVRVLMALADERALPAGRLAEEAGVAASTVSNHLSVLLERGLVAVEQQGRHRYYRLADAEVEGVLEALARLAPRTPITSLREHTRVAALRAARTCYHHLAGQAGVALFRQFLDAGWVTGGDGLHHPGTSRDRLSAPGSEIDYTLTPEGAAALSAWAIPPHTLSTTRPLRYCVDWTEQAHHLAGPLGTAITARLFDLGWITRGNAPRSIRITAQGRDGLSALTPPLPSGRDFGPSGGRIRAEIAT